MVELEVVEKPPVAAKRAAARPAELAGPKAPTKRLSLVARDVIEQDALDAGRIAHDGLIAEHALCLPDRLLVSHHRNRGERIVFHCGKRGKEQKLGSIRSDRPLARADCTGRYRCSMACNCAIVTLPHSSPLQVGLTDSKSPHSSAPRFKLAIGYSSALPTLIKVGPTFMLDAL